MSNKSIRFTLYKHIETSKRIAGMHANEMTNIKAYYKVLENVKSQQIVKYQEK